MDLLVNNIHYMLEVMSHDLAAVCIETEAIKCSSLLLLPPPHQRTPAEYSGESLFLLLVASRDCCFPSISKPAA